MGFNVIFVVFLYLTAVSSAQTIETDGNATRRSSEPRPKVNVTIVYATLCPDSKGFIGEQLWPTYRSNIGSIMNIEFVPWGKASFERERHSWSFICQHGPKECYGNTVHACVLDLHNDFNQTMSFIHCSMTGEERNAPNEYAACATKNGIDWNRTSVCADGAEGNELLHGHGVRSQSLRPSLVFVPWIVINGKFRGRTLELALDNFPKVVCDAYGNPRPSDCPNA